MPTADSSLTSLRESLEVTYGLAPTGVGSIYKELRMVSESLGQDKEIIQSDEISPDRMSPDNIQVGSSASGDHVAELTGGGAIVGQDTWDTRWLAALGATAFSTLQGNIAGVLFSAGTITPANAVDPDDITLTLSGGTPGVWSAGFIAGEFILLGGLTGVLAVLNTTFMVKSGGGTTVLTLTAGPRVPSSPGTFPANTLFAVQAPSITNGLVARSFAQERKYNLPNEFGLLSGMVLTGFDLEWRPKRPMRVTWRWLGKEEVSKTATQAETLVPAVTSRKSFSMVSDLRGISLDDDGHSFFMNAFTLSVKNGAYLQDEQGGTLGAIGVGMGTFDITGSYEFYYQAGTVHQDLYNFTSKKLAVMVANANADMLAIHLPRINWTGGRRAVQGKDQAVKGVVQFRAAKGPGPFIIRLARL